MYPGQLRMRCSLIGWFSLKLKILLRVLLALLVLLAVGPFLVPVYPLEGTVPPEQLADPDSRFIEVNGLNVHYKIQGEGQPTFLLLHGFGASVFSWREVMSPLAAFGTVIAYDRPAFGLTERPLSWEGVNPYSSEGQLDLLFGLLDALGIESAVLVGNSAGGTLALQAALQTPERVQALILVDAAVYVNGPPQVFQPFLRSPQARRLGPLLVRSIRSCGMSLIERAWHDPLRLTPEILAGYQKPLRAENWDRALWEMTLAWRPDGLAEQLDEIRMPVLVITGDDDRIVPPEQSIRLAGELPNATLGVLENCGHLPQEECPVAFLQAVEAFLKALFGRAR